MVASPSNIRGATLLGLANASGIANGSNSPQVTSCYSQATVTMSNPWAEADTPGADVAANATTTNSYPNAEAGTLSGQALADYLNAGLDPVAFVVDENDNVKLRSDIKNILGK